MTEKILIIKHGALGDLINSLGVCAFIRRHHSAAFIALLTAPPYKEIARKTGYFDEVITDRRQAFYGDFLRLRGYIKTFNQVYDLQNSPRTEWYYRLLRPGYRPKWCGIARGCDFPQTRADREELHAYERFADQIRQSGVMVQEDTLYPDLSALEGDVSHLNIPQNAIVLMPGSSKQGAYKRWPAQYYGQLCHEIVQLGYTPVIVAGPDDLDAVAIIEGECKDVLNLTLKTSFFDLVGLARRAKLVIGNDTGPVHIAAVAGAATLILWSKASPPHIYAPKGPQVQVLYRENLESLTVESVKEEVLAILKM